MPSSSMARPVPSGNPSSFIPQQQRMGSGIPTTSSRRKVLGAPDDMGMPGMNGNEYGMNTSRIPANPAHRTTAAATRMSPAPGYKSILTRQKDGSGADAGHYSSMYRG
jgi:hypothetical protein